MYRPTTTSWVFYVSFYFLLLFFFCCLFIVMWSKGLFNLLFFTKKPVSLLRKKSLVDLSMKKFRLILIITLSFLITAVLFESRQFTFIVNFTPDENDCPSRQLLTYRVTQLSGDNPRPFIEKFFSPKKRPIKFKENAWGWQDK